MTRRTFLASLPAAAAAAPGRTTVAIDGERFLINGRPTYAGRSYNGMRIEGLLMNTRMVQGTYDDLNPETRRRWAYPDTGRGTPGATHGSLSPQCLSGGVMEFSALP